MFNAMKLKGKMAEKGYTQQSISAVLGINPSTFQRKMSGDTEFNRGEIAALRKALELTSEEVDGIFFAEELA